MLCSLAVPINSSSYIDFIIAGELERLPTQATDDDAFQVASRKKETGINRSQDALAGSGKCS